MWENSCNYSKQNTESIFHIMSSKSKYVLTLTCMHDAERQWICVSDFEASQAQKVAHCPFLQALDTQPKLLGSCYTPPSFLRPSFKITFPYSVVSRLFLFHKDKIEDQERGWEVTITLIVVVPLIYTFLSSLGLSFPWSAKQKKRFSLKDSRERLHGIIWVTVLKRF